MADRIDAIDADITRLPAVTVLLSSTGMRYHDLGHDYYDQQRHTARQVARHVSKLSSLGHEATPSPAPRNPAIRQASRPPDHRQPEPVGTSRRRVLPSAS